MIAIPNFIIKRMYRSGSLRLQPDGMAFDIQNNVGPGSVIGVHFVRFRADEEITVLPEQLLFSVGDVQRLGHTISEDDPLTSNMGELVTCLARELVLPVARYEITLDLLSLEGGRLAITVQDQLTLA
ncbi:MAG: hypothetical protein AB7P76_12445 [Candidatus Melainabacteria bacterium]